MSQRPAPFGPVRDRDDGQPRGVIDNEFDVVGVGSAATLIDDDDGLTELTDAQLEMAVGGRSLAGPSDVDFDGLVADDVFGDGDQGRTVERRESLRRNPIRGRPGLPVWARNVINQLYACLRNSASCRGGTPCLPCLS